MTRTKLATTLQDARLRQALTQRDLARIIGVHRQTVWHWEQQSSIPGLRTLRHLADVLELDWEDLLRHRADAERATRGRHAKRGRPTVDTVTAVAAVLATALF